MFHRPGIVAVVCLVAVSSVGNAQITTVKNPPIIKQGPGIKPVNPGLKSTTQDTLQVRNLTVGIGDATPFTSYNFLSWKAKDRRQEFLLKHVGPTYAKARVSVYAYQAPTAISNEMAPVFRSVSQIKNMDPKANPQLVYTANFENVQSGVRFPINFADFAPFGGIARKAPVQNAGGRPKLAGAGRGGESPGVMTLRGPAAAKAAKDRNEYMAYLISAQGYVRFFIQFEPQDGNSSTLSVVDYGEPSPGPGTTHLEIFTGVAKGEAAFDSWGTEKETLTIDNYFETYRWTTDVSSEAQAIWQVADKPFPQSANVFNDPSSTLGWGALTEFAKAGTPIASGPHFSPVISWLLGEPGNADRYFYIRLVLLNADGTLAGAPSNAIKLRLAAKVPKPNTPPPPTTWMEFTEEIVGYGAPQMDPTDPYQFKLTRTPDSDLAQWQKLTGKSNPSEGDPVYLPPAPPPEDKAWYEKVFDVITYFIGKLEDIANTVDKVASVMLQAMSYLPELIPAIGKELGVNKLDKYTTAIGLDHAFSAAGWVNGQASTAISMANHPDYYAASILDQTGVPATEWLQMKSNVVNAVHQAALGARPTNPANFAKLLVPNPDYATHPAYVFLRVHATQKGDKSKPLVSSPGTYRIAAKGYWEDPGSIGGNKGWMDMYEKYVTVPSMGDGMDMIVPIAIDYHHSFYEDKNWRYHYHRVIQMHWFIGYDDKKTVNGTASWGSK